MARSSGAVLDGSQDAPTCMGHFDGGARLQSGNACIHANTCVLADCRVDSDCGPGNYCSPNASACGFPSGFHCHKATDPCFNDSDCTCAGGYHSVCAYSTDVKAYVCSQVTCAG